MNDEFTQKLPMSPSIALRRTFCTLVVEAIHFIRVFLMELDDRSRKSSEQCSWIVSMTISSPYGACRKIQI